MGQFTSKPSRYYADTKIEKVKTREELEWEVRQFLQDGGKIEEVPAGAGQVVRAVTKQRLGSDGRSYGTRTVYVKAGEDVE